MCRDVTWRSKVIFETGQHALAHARTPTKYHVPHRCRPKLLVNGMPCSSPSPKRTADAVQSGCRAAPSTAGCELLEQAHDGWPLSDKAVLWAKSTVWSRAFNIPYLGQLCTYCTALHTNKTKERKVYFARHHDGSLYTQKQPQVKH